MIPRLGIFTSPDPVPGGSCTTYGYTCGDPINDSDLPGTFSWGQVVGIAVALVVSLVLPEFAGFMFAAEAGIWATAVATVVAGAAGGPITMGIADAIDGTTHSAASYGWSILSGAITGAVSGGVGFFLSKAPNAAAVASAITSRQIAIARAITARRQLQAAATRMPSGSSVAAFTV